MEATFEHFTGRKCRSPVVRSTGSESSNQPVLEKVGSVAYKLELPQELSMEPVEILEWEIKRLKRSRIPHVKVPWNSRRGPEFTWEHEDSFKKKYPHLFKNQASSSTTTS
ncbi:hypothetical protein Tco_1030701 [Tanacetum coccineum]|uniref:Reverse transcriptase domain-containing protein n=1 Tax=Tanacetum coccineum TaxID=301880 RepID=A0ABQ5G8E4_9ASTR